MRRIVLAACLLASVSTFAQDSSRIVNGVLSPLTVSGYAEAYYSHDFNNLINNAKPAFLFSFNKNNEPSVNLAFIKGAYVMNRTRANLAFAAGIYMNANYAAEPGILNNSFEGNVGVKLSRKITCGWMLASSLHISVLRVLRVQWGKKIGF